VVGLGGLALVVGIGALGVGAWVARWPVSDQIVRHVVESIEASSGRIAPPGSVRASIKRARQKAGFAIAVFGAILIGAACGSL
jgi:hypothetical protein